MRTEILVNSLLLTLGLAFEAFMVSLANGLKTQNSSLKRACLFGAVFAICHAVSLWIGYALVKSVADNVAGIENALTVIAVAVLLFLGIKMIVEGVRKKEEKPAAAIAEFALQSTVASFDAFAVGLTVPDYSIADTAFCSVSIAAVIFAFFAVGFFVGKKFGDKFKKSAAVLGGLVFIGVAAEIAVTAWVLPQ